jgi:hypothetical protein
MDFGLSFGAVGDFISITVLIKDIIVALDDTRGSAKQYRVLVQDLDTPRLTLKAVQQAFEDPSLTNSLEDLSKLVLVTVSQINDCLNTFLDQIRKYEHSLGPGVTKTNNSLAAIGRRIQWKSTEKEIDKFRAEVMGCTSALKVLLEVITL